MLLVQENIMQQSLEDTEQWKNCIKQVFKEDFMNNEDAPTVGDEKSQEKTDNIDALMNGRNVKLTDDNNIMSIKDNQLDDKDNVELEEDEMTDQKSESTSQELDDSRKELRNIMREELKNDVRAEVDNVNMNSVIDESRTNDGAGSVQNSESESTETSKLKYNVKKFSTLIDTDSEDDLILPRNADTNRIESDNKGVLRKNVKQKHISKKKLVNTDSKDKITPSLKKSRNRKKRVMDREEEDEKQDKEYRDEEKEEKDDQVMSKLQTLLDSESEGDEQSKLCCAETMEEENREISKSERKPVKEKKRMGSLRTAKDMAMKQIHSETQRLIRESEIVLPYHIPKQRTLQDFLSRKKISVNLPKAPTMAAKLKMSSVIVNEALEEKEKEAELFYKSFDSEDSDSEEASEKLADQKLVELQKDASMRKSAVQNGNDKPDGAMESPAIEATQKSMKLGQDFYKKKETIQQGKTCLGAPRKLFELDSMKDVINDVNNSGDELLSESYKETTMDTILADKLNNPENRNKIVQRNKEHLRSLREGSLPRKLVEMFTEGPRQSKNEETSKTVEPCLKEEQVIDNAEKTNLLDVRAEIIKTPHITKEKLTKLLEKSTMEIAAKTEGHTEELLMLADEDLKNMISSTQVCKQDSSLCSDLTKSADRSENVEKPKNNLQTQTGQTENDFIGDQTGKMEQSFSYADTVRNCFGIDPSDNYSEFGQPPPIIDEYPGESEEQNGQSVKISMKKKLLLQLPKLDPKIKGSPGVVIDLTTDVKPQQEGVHKLLDRFFCKHFKSKNKQAENSDVSIICLEETSNGPVAMKQKLPYKTPQIQVENKELSKPGAKLQRLKEELELKMAIRRGEEWKQKEEGMKNGEESEMEDEELLPEDKQEDTDVSEDAETEPEEDDVIIKERKKKNCKFLDEEAEVSEGEGEELEINSVTSEEGEETKRKHKYFEDEPDEDDKESMEEENKDTDGEGEEEEEEEVETRRKLKRVIKPFDDDSDEAESLPENNVKSINSRQVDVGEDSKTNSNEKKEEKSTKHRTDFFKSDIKLKTKEERVEENGLKKKSLNTNEEEDWQGMLLSQKIREKTSFGRTITDTDIFVSENEESRNTQDMLELSQTPLYKENILDLISPATQLTVLNAKLDSCKKDEYFCNKENMTPKKRMSLQKKLFDDSPETNDEDLLQLCSGTFSLERMNSDPKPLKDGKDGFHLSDEPEITDSQLEALCSGSFNTPTLQKSETKVKTDERETSKEQHPKPCVGLRLVSSDEEGEEEKESITAGHSKKKKGKKLELSDESDQENWEVQDSEEEKDLGGEEDLEEDQNKFVDYDSEENEVVIVPKKGMKEYAARFLENEAELSDESEYHGSDDENEEGMDELELEEGDAEEIDEKKIKDQLGKMRMRQILDEDQREVNMLKEILFEDGDLHSNGSGRERKFKWRNIDKLGEVTDRQNESEDKDGWLDLLEDENEVEWRKMRHEREKFLAEKKKELDDEIDAELNDSEIFKLGVKTLKKIEINQSMRQNNAVEVPDVIQLKTSHTISDLLNSSDLGGKSRTIQSVMQKRSLLARGEESLARIAMIARQNEPSVLLKNARNFIFTHISPSTEHKAEGNSGSPDSKSEETDQSFMHRKRKASSSFPPRAAKRTKADPGTKGRKLF